MVSLLVAALYLNTEKDMNMLPLSLPADDVKDENNSPTPSPTQAQEQERKLNFAPKGSLLLLFLFSRKKIHKNFLMVILETQDQFLKMAIVVNSALENKVPVHKET